MAQSETDPKVALDSHDGKKDAKANSVADYLQAPRRKRGNYVITALGERTVEFQGGIDAFVKAQFKNASLLHVKSTEELVKAFRRRILLVVVDDEFMDLPACLRLVAKFKSRGNAGAAPCLFLTRNPESLIQTYGQYLQAFQEGDDYINYAKFGLPYITSRIKAGLLFQYRRRSRRYKIDVPLQYILLSDDQKHAGRMIDLSVHGGLLEATDGYIFRVGEQLKLHMPLASGSLEKRGEFLHVSAKVRRVMISGSKAGISFEYLSEPQSLAITAFITELSRRQLTKRVGVPRVQAGHR